MTGIIENVATAAMTLTAATLTAISALAWRHSRSTKVLLLAIGFGLFFVKGTILSIGLFASVDWGDAFLPVSVLLDLAVLGVFYLAVLRPTGT